jgi:hypothetical protein
MPVLRVPNENEKKHMIANFCEDLKSFTIHNYHDDSLHRVVCCVCDSLPHGPNWHKQVSINQLAELCSKSDLTKKNMKFIILPNFYWINTLFLVLKD